MSGADAVPLWTDSHCHLQASKDPEGDLRRAAESGTRRLIVVGTDETTSREAIALATRRPSAGVPAVELWATVGLHPHDASTGLAGVASLLGEVTAKDPLPYRVVAVGECGLDFHYDYSPRATQRTVFAAQIGMANMHDMALVVHTREAWEETFVILDHEGMPPRTVFHCFTGGPDEAGECLERGASLSFSGILTFTSADDLRAAAVACPMDRLLIETDAPFLTPVPHRGKPNEPAYVSIIGERLAQLKELPVVSAAEATTANAARVFGLLR